MEQEKRTFPLSLAKIGVRLKVVEIDAGFGLRRRLAELGLIPGAEIELVSVSNKGPCVISVKGVRMILGYGVAAKVLVV